MSFVMRRSWARARGLEWPPEVAAITNIPAGVNFALGPTGLHDGPLCGRPYRVITWGEVMANRRQKQTRRLAAKRAAPEPERMPCYVWVFDVPGPFFTGWWCHVVTHSHRVDREGRPVVEFVPVTRRSGRDPLDKRLAESIMRAAPCGFLPDVSYFRLWMPEFARQHPRRGRRREGSLVGWLAGGQFKGR